MATTRKSLSPTAAEEAAASWLARHDAGLSADELADFQRWWAADPGHAAAWQEIDATWRALDAPRHAGVATELIQELNLRRQRRQRRFALALGTGLAAAAAIALLLLHPDPSRGMIQRTEERVLTDGTVVELDRGARIDVRYEANRRHVRLLQGEALFTVAKDSARPFIVSVGAVDVQAVGTAFAVQARPDTVNVVVTEGRVAVERAGPAAAAGDSVLVGAGSRLLVPVARAAGEELRPEVLSAADLSRQLAWRGPRLELAATRLRDALTLLNGLNQVQLRVTDPNLADLRLSGVFRADDAEGFVRLLQANYDVQVERRGAEVDLHGR